MAASALVALSATAYDGATYEPVNGLECTNNWIKAINFNKDAKEAIGCLNHNRYRAAVIHEDKVYVANSYGDKAQVDIIDATNGDYIKTLVLTLNGANVTGTLQMTQVGVDSYGNLWGSPYMANSTWGTKVYIIDKETGAITRRLLVMGENRRIDHMDVVGDLTLVNDDCIIMSASSTVDFTVF